MAVVINPESGLAQDLPQEQATSALTSGRAHLPLVSPEGDVIVAPFSDYQKLTSEGHTHPSPEQLQSMLSYAKHSSTAEQLKTFGEGAAEAATFGTSPLIEQAMGVNLEDIAGRRQTNPNVHMAGQVTGLLGSQALIPGGGAAGLMGRAGEAVAELAPQGAGMLARSSQAAVKTAVDTALFQSGDEVAKALVHDPEQSASSALVDIGLAGLMGGVVGGAGKLVVDPLWQATKGSSVGRFLEAAKNKAINNGLGATELPEVMQKASSIGVEVPRSIQGAISGDAAANQAAGELFESAAKAGEKYRADLDTFKSNINNSILEGFGRTADDVGLKMSDYERGALAQKQLVSELKGISDPIGARFEPIQEKFKSVELPAGTRASIVEDLSNLAHKEGYALSESSPAMAEINRVIKDLPNLHTLEDLRKYQGVIRANVGDIGGYKLQRQITGLFRDAENASLDAVLGEKAPELLAEHKLARQGYKDLMEHLDTLNDRLHVGKYWGPGSFIKNLSEMSPEDVLRRLRGTNDAGMLDMLSKYHPGTAEQVKQHYVDQLFNHSTSQGELNTRTFYRALDKMSPEAKDFALGQGAQRLDTARELFQALPERMNPSGTGRAIDTLLRKVPGGAGAMLLAATGHNPLLGYALGHMSQVLGREAPDAAKLAFLKMLGTDAVSSPAGFKSMFRFIESAYKAQEITSKAVKAIFKPGASVLADSLIPTEAQKKVIEKGLRVAQAQPDQLMKATGEVGHYLPEQAAALAQSTATIANYLNSVKPNTDKTSPLGDKRVPSAPEIAKYNRALDIAQQPLVVLKSLKEGTISPSDIEALQTMHPRLYETLKENVMTHLADAASDEVRLPHKVAQGLSLFLGMPLESSMMPQNVQANQALYLPQGPQQNAPIKAPRGLKTDFKGTVSQAALPSQQRQLERQSRK